MTKIKWSFHNLLPHICVYHTKFRYYIQNFISPCSDVIIIFDWYMKNTWSWYFEPLHLEQATICTWPYKIKKVGQVKTTTTLQVTFLDPCSNDLFIFIALPKKLEQALDWYPKIFYQNSPTHSLCFENIRFYKHALTRCECTSLLLIKFPSWFHNNISPCFFAMEIIIPFNLHSSKHALFLQDFCNISVTDLLRLLKVDASFYTDPIIQLFEEVFLSI